MFIQKSTVFQCHVLSNCQHDRVTMATLLTPVRHALSMLPSKMSYIKMFSMIIGMSGLEVVPMRFLVGGFVFYRGFVLSIVLVCGVCEPAAWLADACGVLGTRRATAVCAGLPARRHCVYKTLEGRPLVDSFICRCLHSTQVSKRDLPQISFK